MDRITIITTSVMGICMGLSLKQYGLNNTEVIGSSNNHSLLKSAIEIGAFDKTSSTLKSAVKNAGLIIIDMPLTDTGNLIKTLSPLLQKECVVTDTGTNKLQVLNWAKQHMPPNASFVAGRPLFKNHLPSVENAHSSIFQNIDYCIIPAENASSLAIKTVTGMIELLGSRPFFIDAAEHDSITAATSFIPGIISSALVQSLSCNPAWKDIARVAGTDFRQISSLMKYDPTNIIAGSMTVPDSVVSWIDQIIATLNHYRSGISEQNDGLRDSLMYSHDTFSKWSMSPVTENDGVPSPKISTLVGQMFLGARLTERLGQLTNFNKEKESHMK